MLKFGEECLNWFDMVLIISGVLNLVRHGPHLAQGCSIRFGVSICPICPICPIGTSVRFQGLVGDHLLLFGQGPGPCGRSPVLIICDVRRSELRQGQVGDHPFLLFAMFVVLVML